MIIKERMQKLLYKIMPIFLLVLFMWPIMTPQIEIEGRIRLVGTAMFPELVITTDDDVDYVFEKELFETFNIYQNQTITIKATVKEEVLRLADGSKEFTVLKITKARLLE